MSSLPEMLTLLVEALRNPAARESAVREFQLIARMGPVNGNPNSKKIYEVLADLAYDLEYFVPDPVRRAEDPSYYGHEQLEQEIKVTLRRLGELGVEVPAE